MSHGFTTLELAIVLTLMVLIAGVAAPTLTSAWDGLRVRAAREEFVGQVQRARSAALRTGSATLEVRADSALVRVLKEGETHSQIDFRTRYGVEIGLSGNSRAVRLRFGRLGLGVMASRTVELFRRGDTASVSLSTFGRLRRW